MSQAGGWGVGAGRQGPEQAGGVPVVGDGRTPAGMACPGRWGEADGVG